MNTYIPPYSDLGIDVTPETENSWSHMIQKINLYHEYFSGEIFNEYVQDTSSNASENVPLYPAGINLVKTIATALADALWGEWEEFPVHFTVRGSKDPTSDEEKAIEIANDILMNSDAGQALWEIEVDRQVYGGGALRVRPQMSKEEPITWERITRDNLLPIWDPEDPDKLIEAWVLTRMNSDQAKIKFGYDGHRQQVIYWEHWRPDRYQTGIDDVKLVDSFNTWGLVPIVFIPRVRTTYLWGDALTEDLIPLQDTLNMRVADVDDTISYNSHPIKYGVNLPRTFSAENFPIGSNAMWDLGRQGGDLEPKVGLVEPKGQVIGDAMGYIRFIYEVARTSSSTPAVVFGEDYGSGQRSGDTLEIRMRPMVALVRRNRAYWTTGIRQALKITSRILKQKQYPDIPVRAIERLGSLVPRYNPILPRDQNAIVDEVVKLLSTDPPSISLETAVLKLGFGVGEVEKVKRMLADDDLRKPMMAPIQEENSENSIPNGRARSVPGQKGSRPSAENSQRVQPGSEDDGE